MLKANKEYVKDEAVAYVDQQIAGNTGIWTGFTYEKANYERDVGRLMDALVNDVKYGGNASITKRSTSYWIGTTSTLAGPPNEQQQFAAMIDYVKSHTMTLAFILQANINQIFQMRYCTLL